MLSRRAEVKLDQGSSPRLVGAQINNRKIAAVVKKTRYQYQQATRGRVGPCSVKNVVRDIQRSHVESRQLLCAVCLAYSDQHPRPDNGAQKCRSLLRLFSNTVEKRSGIPKNYRNFVSRRLCCKQGVIKGTATPPLEQESAHPARTEF